MYHQSIVGGSGLLCPWFNPAFIISDLGSASFLKSLPFASSFFLKCFKAVIVVVVVVVVVFVSCLLPPEKIFQHLGS